MEIYDIDTLQKDESGNFDLTQLTFEYRLDNTLSQYVVQRGEEMRLDLICQSIYGNLDYMDIICNINNIDNPLNLREGQIIIYPATNLDIYRFSERNNQNSTNEENIRQLANSNKSSRKDSNRKEYLENNLSLPPTILKKRTNQFNTEGEKIVLGRGLI